MVIRRSRRGQVARELLGAPCWGGWVTDRWRASPWYPAWRRDLDALAERGGRACERGEAVRAPAQPLFQGWPGVREGTVAHRTFASARGPVRREGERLLDVGQPCSVPTTDGTCRALLKRRQAVGTFVRHAGVEPTKHAAEPAIRPGGLWRKLMACLRLRVKDADFADN